VDLGHTVAEEGKIHLFFLRDILSLNSMLLRVEEFNTLFVRTRV